MQFQVLRYNVALVQIECRIAANELTALRVSSPFAELTVRPNRPSECVKMFGPIHWTADFVLWMLRLSHLGSGSTCYMWPFEGRRPTVPTFHTVCRSS
jgi:hypothetical protein